jgi:TRAP-type C4-dicarboxylate transport system substrate-binding protein
MAKQKIKWLLFHEPAELFIRTAEDFQKHLDKLTNNKYEIEILTLAEYQDKYYDGIICDPFTELKEGRVHASQIFLDILGESDATDFYALSMPYLFKDHDHASRVFEGEIGKELFEHLYQKAKVRGLAYTYSGGYRCIASDTPVRSIKDFAGKTYFRGRNPVHADMIDLVGAKKVDSFTNSFVQHLDGQQNCADLDWGKVNMTQTTYPRYHVDAYKSQKYVADTKHSMYMTTILLNDDFWNSLTTEDQGHMKTAGLYSAKTERMQTVADAEEIKTSKNKQKELGIEEIITWSDEEIEKLSKLWSPLYKKYNNLFSKDILNKIKNA